MTNKLNNLFNPENEFFQLTKGAKRLTHISLSSFILPIIFLFIAGLIFQVILTPLVLPASGGFAPWVHDIFQLIVLFGIIIVLIFLWIKFFEGRTISSLGFSRNGAIKKYLKGFAFGIIINTIIVAIMALLGNIEIAKDSLTTTGVDAIGIVALFLLGFLVQGASEEILSRGWMMQVIGARYKPWLGVLISTIIFAVLHLGNAGVNILSVLNLVLISFLFCLFVLNDSSLWFACAWHSSWNWMLGNVYGLSVSGHGEKVSIFDLNTKGNELISGGGFGPEGSIVTTIVLIATIIYFGNKVINKHQ